MNDVFVSYSRRNKPFVQKLVDALSAEGFSVWIDWEDIAKGTDWLKEIYAGIAGADSFIFVVSKDSFISEVCAYELKYALDHGKKILPVIHQDITIEDVGGYWIDKEWETTARENWQKIGHINWTFFREQDDFDVSFKDLVKTIQTDLGHVKAHTRLTIRADEWQNGGGSSAYLLRGDDLNAAKSWLVQADAEGKYPAASELIREYIAASEHRQLEREAEEKRTAERIAQFRREQRRYYIVTGILAVIAIAIFVAVGAFYGDQINSLNTEGTAVAVEKDELQAQFALAESQTKSLSLALTAGNLLSNEEADDDEDALALSLVALRIFPSEQAEAVLTQALDRLALTELVLQGTNGVRSVDVSPDGRLLAAGDASGVIRLWNTDANAQVQDLTIGTNDGVWDVVFSPNGELIASSYTGGAVRVWQNTNIGWNLLATYCIPNTSVYALAFAPDSSWLGVGASDGTVKAWALQGTYTAPDQCHSPASEEIRMDVQQNGLLVSDIAISPDGTRLASGGSGGVIMLWNTEDGELIREFANATETRVFALAYSNDGQQVAAGTVDDNIYIFNVEDGAVATTLEGHSGGVRAVTFSPDGQSLLSGSADDTVRLWNLETSSIVRTYRGQTRDIVSVAFAPDGEKIYTASSDRSVWQWFLDTVDLLELSCDVVPQLDFLDVEGRVSSTLRSRFDIAIDQSFACPVVQ